MMSGVLYKSHMLFKQSLKETKSHPKTVSIITLSKQKKTSIKLTLRSISIFITLSTYILNLFSSLSRNQTGDYTEYSHQS